MLVFAATPTNSFWDPESTATTLAKQAAASFLVVDTRMIWTGKNLEIMHPTIADQGKDFYNSKKQKDNEFKFKLTKKCLNGEADCDKCVDAETSSSLDEWTSTGIKSIIPVKKFQEGDSSCASALQIADSIQNNAALTPDFSFSTFEAALRVTAGSGAMTPTTPSMPDLGSLHAVKRHAAWLLYFFYTLLFVFYYLTLRPLAKGEDNAMMGKRFLRPLLFFLFMFFIVIVFGQRDVQLSALDTDNEYRAWTRQQIGKLEKPAYTDSEHGVTWNWNEFAFEDVKTFVDACYDGDDKTIKMTVKDCSPDKIPKVLDSTSVLDSSNNWVVTYVSYGLTMLMYLILEGCVVL